MPTEVAAKEQYLTLSDVATALRLDVRSVRRMIKPAALRGKKQRPAVLKAVNISLGTKRCIWRIAQSELDRFMTSRHK